MAGFLRFIGYPAPGNPNTRRHPDPAPPSPRVRRPARFAAPTHLTLSAFLKNKKTHLYSLPVRGVLTPPPLTNNVLQT